MTAQETSTRLLDAAERAFSARGFDGASLREITAEAGANLAAVHYHFGSKEDLFVAVVARRIEPLNVERLRLLDLAEAARRPRLEAVLEAMIGPMLRVSHQDGEGGVCFMRLLGRIHGESGELWRRVLQGPLREVRERFKAAFQSSVGGLDDVGVAWCMHFVIGATANVMADQHRLQLLSDGRCDARDVDETIERLVRFLAAGVRASSESKPRSKRSTRTRGSR